MTNEQLIEILQGLDKNAKMVLVKHRESYQSETDFELQLNV